MLVLSKCVPGFRARDISFLIYLPATRLNPFFGIRGGFCIAVAVEVCFLILLSLISFFCLARARFAFLTLAVASNLQRLADQDVYIRRLRDMISPRRRVPVIRVTTFSA